MNAIEVVLVYVNTLSYGLLLSQAYEYFPLTYDEDWDEIEIIEN